MAGIFRISVRNGRRDRRRRREWAVPAVVEGAGPLPRKR